MYTPDISVVIPSYNCEKYILKTLESVRDQTYEGMIEMVVVDDCSTDGSLNVITKFAKEFENRRIKIIKQKENSGVAKTRNRGVEESSGEYVCFLDSDDFWDDTKVEKQVELLNRYMDRCDQEWISQNCQESLDGASSGRLSPPVLLCTGRELVDEDGKSLHKIVHVPPVITYDQMLKTNLVPCSSVMLKRSVALDIPMERDDLVEDYINWLKIIKAYGPAAGVDEPLMKYRVIQGSRSHNKLKAARKHFLAQRYVGIAFPSACINFISYVINGVAKSK